MPLVSSLGGGEAGVGGVVVVGGGVVVLSSVLVGGVVAVVSVGVVVAGAGGALGVCALGSWVESVVTSVTGAAALGTAGCAVVGEATVELGTVAATVVGAAPAGTASFGGFLCGRRRTALALPAATRPAEEIVTGCELECVITGSLVCVTGSAALLASAWW